MKKSQPDSEVAGQTAEASKLTAIDVTSIFDAITEPLPNKQTTTPATIGSSVSSSPDVGNLSSMLEKVRAQNNPTQPAQATPASQPEPKPPTTAPVPQLTQKYQVPQSGQTQSGQTTSAAPPSQMPAREAPVESLTRLLDSRDLQSLSIPATKVAAQPVSAVSNPQPQQRAEGDVAVTQIFRAPKQPAESLAPASSPLPVLSGAVSPDRAVDSPPPAQKPEPQATSLPPTATATPDGVGVQTSGKAPTNGGVTQLLQNLWAPSGQPSSAPARVSSSKYEPPLPASFAKVEQRLSSPVVTSSPPSSNTFVSSAPEPVPSRVVPPAPPAPAGEFTRIIQASAFRESVVAGRAAQASQPMEPEPTSQPALTPVFAAAPHLSIMMAIVIALQVVIVLLLLWRH